MPLSAHLLLAATALCCFSTLFAFPMDGLSMVPQCRCLTTTVSYISPRHFRRINIFPPAANCRNTEILITLKNNNTVCVDPEAKWINCIIIKVQKRRAAKSSSESPVPT